MIVGFASVSMATTPGSSRLVVLARTDDADDVTGEALARVSGELTAAGFTVRTVRVPANADPRTTVETVGRELSPAAAFAIFPGLPGSPGLPGLDSKPSAEIWVSDRLTGRATVEHLSVDPRDSDRGVAVLAVRAVELLKASVAELWVGGVTATDTGGPAPPPPASTGKEGAPSTVTATRTPEPPPTFWGSGRLAIEGAPAIVGHVGGFPVDVGALLRLSLGVGRRFAVRLDVFGLDRGWTLSTDDGTARVRAQFATAGVVMALRPGHRLQGLVGAGLGVSRLGLTGTGNAPWLGQAKAIWTATGGVGAGAAFFLATDLALVAELDARFFSPRPAVRVGDPVAGRAGLPALLGTLGLRLTL